MNALHKALFHELNMNPVFAEFCREVEQHKKSTKWKKDRDTADWAYATGFGDGIDFVLKRMGYDNGR